MKVLNKPSTYGWHAVPGEGKTSCNDCDIPPKCHCEERSDEAIQETKFSIGEMKTKTELLTFGLPRFARNDKTRFTKTVSMSTCVAPRNDKGEKSSLARLCRAKQLSIVLREVDLGGYQQNKNVEIETHPRPLPKHGGEKKVAFTLAEGITHVGICDNIRKKAFTLAEVLITLAIIGVVAAMTIPTLVTNYNKRVVEVRLQKTYAEFSQALKLAEAEYGSPASWDYIDNNKIDNFLNKYLLSYIKYSKYCEKNNLEECFEVPIESASGLYGFTNAAIQTNQRAMMLNNGASIFFQSGFESDSPHIHMVIDVNGPKQGANLLGKDIFSMIFMLKVSGIPVESGYAVGKKSVLGFHMYGNDSSPAFTREEKLELCKSENPRICSSLIQNDGWKISDDYPWW